MAISGVVKRIMKQSSLKKDSDYLKSYWNYLKTHTRLLTIGFLLIPCISLFHLLQPYLIKKAIDEHILVNDIDGLLFIVACYAACVLFDFGARTAQMFVFQYIGQRTIMAIRKDLFTHILYLSPTYFDRTPIGVVISRLTSDMESLNESVASGLVTLISDVLTILGILIIMFILSPQLTIITILFVPTLYLIVNVFRLRLRHYYNKIRSTMGKMNGFIQEQLNGITIVQSFLQEEAVLKKFKKLNHTYYQSTIRSVSYDAMLYSIIDSFNSIIIATIIWFSWGQFQKGFITIGLLVAFIDYIHKFFVPLKEISNKFAILQHALAALEKIFGTFAITQHTSSGTKKLERAQGIITFNKVNFAYAHVPEKPILNNISFSVNPGETVAIVGPTGSGKTSILRLLSKLYEGYTGDIHLDHQNIHDYELTDLRSQIALVNQDIHLFSHSIRFNIGLGAATISDETIEWAAKTVNAHHFIEKLPEGYDTVLDKGATSLSAGEAQLITFARALASPAPILLLDEATAAIDSKTESTIQRALTELLKNKTTIVIAHRLSTIRHATKILVLKEGQIIEQGTHQTLMKKSGFYQTLYQSQFSLNNP